MSSNCAATSPFLAVSPADWLCANDLAFAIFDGFPVSPGHVLVTTRRLVETWFDASPAEQASLMALVNEVKARLDSLLSPQPDGYNVGFNSGAAAGQTVPHVHIHVIPRYRGDMTDPRGGVRHVIPAKGNYLIRPPAERPDASAPPSLTLTTGKPRSPLWASLGQRLSSAVECDLLASFVQPSGLDLIQATLFTALRAGARVRILVGDYLLITSADALRRLLGWTELANDFPAPARLEVRLAELSQLSARPASFHPKAWRIADATGGLVVVGSSNLSRAALQTGIEWNLIGHTTGTDPIDTALTEAFADLWQQSTPLSAALVTAYAERVAAARQSIVPPESLEAPEPLNQPRPWQVGALARLEEIRRQTHRRALVAVATGLGKTWLAAFDALAFGRALNRAPRILIVAHRAEILIQAEATLRTALLSCWPDTRVSWYLGSNSDLSGTLVVASVQKLTRPEGLAALEREQFDYAVIDEVHHAEAPSYRRVLARLQAGFTLGLTATPERTDGVDVAALFDDVLAWQATVGDGIAEGSLVPFHYLGLKDEVDFTQIPWRNGRFDPQELEAKLENSARMDRLWQAWQAEPAGRTLVFCCSRRHALYTRDWLRRRGVVAPAVFSGTGGDPRSQSLEDFVAGRLAALCVVDLFNEGLDVPTVDRVVLLRPTESKIIFLQQLGRGLRAAEGKTRLKVIDFVGNHRLFASRLIHLLSLGTQAAQWEELKKVLQGGLPDLPAGCLLELELEAKALMLSLLPRAGSAVAEAYRSMRDELERRPSPSELFHHGYLPRTLAAEFGSWFGFVARQGDLTADEQAVAGAFGSWLEMLETTSLNKSYKMVVLRVLLDHDAWWTGMEIGKLAAACRSFILAHPVLRADLPATQQFPDPANAPLAAWAAWWLEWPLSRWMAPQAGRSWFKQEQGRFVAGFACAENLRPAFEALTAELVDYRLAHYARTRLSVATAGAAPGAFVAKVSHSSGNPILRLPAIEQAPHRPQGPTVIELPDGRRWLFRLVKIACNVAGPEGDSGNRLPELLRGWFGPDAGVPGTHYQVRFSPSAQGWRIEPVPAAAGVTAATVIPFPGTLVHALAGFCEAAEEAERYTRLVPVYNLEAAAGLWGPEQTPELIGWAPAAASGRVSRDQFIAQVRGRSMEPKIRDGAWCLFRKCPAGSREGRIVLVQFQSQTDPELGGRYTVKKYHSVKRAEEDSWAHEHIELQPLNPEFKPIIVEPSEAQEMVVVGEFIAQLG
jgi:superfamily II DNA or RNA helicase/diadenosine tetraphosphate (Ap4A) HIT family hydrolase/HKD family nuclease